MVNKIAITQATEETDSEEIRIERHPSGCVAIHQGRELWHLQMIWIEPHALDTVIKALEGMRQ